MTTNNDNIEPSDRAIGRFSPDTSVTIGRLVLSGSRPGDGACL